MGTIEQKITVEDLQQLSPEQKNKLREWWKPQKYDVCICDKYNEGHEVFVWSEFTSTTKEKKLELLYGGMGHHSATKQQCLPLLDIGQMIEILHNQDFNFDQYIKHSKTGQVFVLSNILKYAPENFYDFCWEAVKAIL